MSRIGLVAAGSVAASLVAVFLTLACAPREQPSWSSGIGGASARHAVDSDELEGLMANLDRLAFEDLPQEIDMHAERTRMLVRAGQVARSIEATSERIPDALDDVEISVDARRRFERLAERLEGTVERLAREAEEGSLSGVTEAYGDMIEVCDRCHTAFRVLPRVGTSK